MAQAHGPRIVTDGLVFCVDAANVKSYPGSGNTWSNLANTNSSGTFSGATYDNGSIDFVPNSFVPFINDTALDTQTPSVEVWVKTDALTQYGFWFEKGTVNTQYSLFQEGTNITWRTAGLSPTDIDVTTATYMNTTSWYQIVGTFTSGSKKLYINAVERGSSGVTGTISTSAGGMSIGAYGGYNGGRSYYYNGRLASCKVYNKVLTPEEVSQNFNALRGRYGI